MPDIKSIMCFGDSLTWGWVPILDGAPTTRYPYPERWTGVMADELGAQYRIVEEGLSGRTTSIDDPNDPRLNGSAYLPAALATHLPLDLVILFLGTNDTKSFFHRSAFEIANGMAKLVGQVAASAGGVGTAYPAPATLVVAPPPLAETPHPFVQGTFDGGHEKSMELGTHYRGLADFMKVDFLDAGEFVTTGGCDGIHFTAQNNRALGKALAERVREILN